jgi:hypothetical protein
MDKDISDRRQRKLQSRKERNDEPYNSRYVRIRENITINSTQKDLPNKSTKKKIDNLKLYNT